MLLLLIVNFITYFPGAAVQKNNGKLKNTAGSGRVVFQQRSLLMVAIKFNDQDWYYRVTVNLDVERSPDGVNWEPLDLRNSLIGITMDGNSNLKFAAEDLSDVRLEVRGSDLILKTNLGDYVSRSTPFKVPGDDWEPL